MMGTKKTIEEKIEKKLLEIHSGVISYGTIPSRMYVRENISDKQLSNARKKFAKYSNSERIILLCDTSLTTNGNSGILFTNRGFYYNCFYKTPELCPIRWNEVLVAKCEKSYIRFTMIDNTEHRIYASCYSGFLCEAIKRVQKILKTEKCSPVSAMNKKKTRTVDLMYNGNTDHLQQGITAGTLVYGNVSNASTIYNSDKFNASKGHGFAAENANHLYDKITNLDITGEKVKLVGEEIDPETGRILKNGADRIVNGVNIQTKYCRSGSKCIEECFQDGQFRYYNPDGTPMQIEVPSDYYDAAVQALESRIRNGELPGVTDPAKAKEIVRKGHFTYQQVKNIAKAGTVESIAYDAANGTIIATCAFGISSLVTFAVSIWNGEDCDVALRNAASSGLRVFGPTFISAILTGQLAKAGLNSALVNSSEAIVKLMGPKASAVIANAFRSGTNIYGASAMKSTAKLLRSNAIANVATVFVLSSVDIANIFSGRISGKQLFKNLANTVITVTGSSAGWVGGAAAGATVGSVIPIVGTAAGAFVGGLAGAFAAGAASSKVADAALGAFIEDDAEYMVRIIERIFEQLAEDYLLTKTEAERIVEKLQQDIDGRTLKDMYESNDRQKFAINLMINIVEDEVCSRQIIQIPSDAEMQRGLRDVLEAVADNEYAY